jgi:glycosyltransferase involved in cell wall biosynthesis
MDGVSWSATLTMESVPPIVSVCIPAFNAGRTIEATVRSVLDQDIPDLEIVVSDNASTDDTVQRVSQMGHPSIRIITQSHNCGMVRNYEAVIGDSRGRYVKLLCADDLLYAGGLRRELDSFLTAPKGVVMVVARREVVVSGRGRLPSWQVGNPRDGLESGCTLQRRVVATGRNLIGEGQAVLMRGDVARAAVARGLGDPYVVDLSLWFHCLDRGDVLHLPHIHGVFTVSRSAATWQMRSQQRVQMSRFLRTQATARGYPKWVLTIGIARSLLGHMIRRGLYRVATTLPR